MIKEYAQQVLVAILIGSSGSGYYCGNIEDYDRNSLQELIYLIRILIWNDTAVCGGKRGVKI